MKSLLAYACERSVIPTWRAQFSGWSAGSAPEKSFFCRMPLMPLLPTCRPDRHPCKSSPAYVYMIVVPYIYYIYLLHLVLLHLVSPSTLYRRSAPSAAYRPGTCSTALGVLSVRIRISVQNDAGRLPHCRWYHETAAELYAR